MRFTLKAVFALLFFFTAISCKKDAEVFNKKNETQLPNFGNVDLEKVFTKQDSELPNRSQIVEELNRYYTTVWNGGDLWGGILVAKGDDILLEKYRGFAHENKQDPISPETSLHVASVSKTLTAMATLKLAEAGKLKLDDPVTKFFPRFPYPEVTVFTLLSQRSGLPKYENFIEKLEPKPAELSKPFLTNQDVLDLLIKYKPALARPTNTGFMYCNTNFALLALIIEKVTKTPFPEAMQQMVFRPLQMKHTFIFQEKDLGTASKSFYSRGPKEYPLDRLDLIYGDKNVYTTVRDLFNFSKAMFSKDFLKPELMNMVFEPYSNEKPGVNNYGLGFRMKIFDNGEKLTYHNGWWHGSNAVFVHLPKSKVTIVATGNKYSNRVYSAMAISGLFENFPVEQDRLKKELGMLPASQGDSLKTGSDNYSE